MSSGLKLYLGTIELGERVYITDPCYSIDTWCQRLLNNVISGTYYCHIICTKSNFGGRRVKRLVTLHESIKDKRFIRYSYASSIIGVDSGQAGFFDEDYYEEHQPEEKWYKEICRITLNSDAGTIDRRGVVSCSGYGDGRYRLYVHNNKGKVDALKLEFIE